MKQESKIPSPCISVCTVDEDTGFCRGCLRTLKEIAEWPHYSDPVKRGLLDMLDKRRPLINNATKATSSASATPSPPHDEKHA